MFLLFYLLGFSRCLFIDKELRVSLGSSRSSWRKVWKTSVEWMRFWVWFLGVRGSVSISYRVR